VRTREGLQSHAWTKNLLAEEWVGVGSARATGTCRSESKVEIQLDLDRKERLYVFGRPEAGTIGAVRRCCWSIRGVGQKPPR
jgi:hypothetical protein